MKVDWQKLYDLGHETWELNRLIESDMLTSEFMDMLGNYFRHRRENSQGFDTDISPEIASIKEKLDMWVGSKAIEIEDKVGKFLATTEEEGIDTWQAHSEIEEIVSLASDHRHKDQYGKDVEFLVEKVESVETLEDKITRDFEKIERSENLADKVEQDLRMFFLNRKRLTHGKF